MQQDTRVKEDRRQLETDDHYHTVTELCDESFPSVSLFSTAAVTKSSSYPCKNSFQKICWKMSVAASLRKAVHAALLLLSCAFLYQQHHNFHCLPTKTVVQSLDLSSTPSSAQLQCYQQSLGFFDDIPNDAWECMRRKANDFVQFANPQNPEIGIENSFMWNLNNLEPSFTCPHVQRMGGRGDGPKWTCDPHRLMKRKDCLIYSFGSAGQYEFEDSHVKLLGKHCEIHVFDPGNYARPNDPVKNNIHYHQWGLKRTGDTAPERSSLIYAQTGPNAVQQKKFLTFGETLGRLGHQNRTIDIFKLDCEGCEWTTYPEWINHDIRQVLIETHNTPRGSSKFYQSFFDRSFALFSKEQNPYGHGTCLEWAFIKLDPSFWQKKS